MSQFRMWTTGSGVVATAAAGLLIGAVLWEGVQAVFALGGVEALARTIWDPAADAWGIGAFLVGTAASTFGALLVAIPVGLLVALYLQTGKHRMTRAALAFLAGLPSVALGLWGFAVVCPYVAAWFGGAGNSLLAAMICLGVMLVPQIALPADAALRTLPPELGWSAESLGVSRERALLQVVLPAARAGVVRAGVMAGLRASGEATAVLMVAGNAPTLPSGLTAPIRTVAAAIAMEMGYASGLHRQVLFAAGAVLLCVTAAVLLLIEVLR